MLEGIIGLIRLDWERQVHVFFTKNRIDLGGKTKEQYLEQLRMAVSLREREGVSLRNYLRSS
jgi:puromycin-sensitive aminopeptidase